MAPLDGADAWDAAIAAELVVSPRTVQHHVAHVYAKGRVPHARRGDSVRARARPAAADGIGQMADLRRRRPYGRPMSEHENRRALETPLRPSCAPKRRRAASPAASASPALTPAAI
jgi:hypothetical protein